MFPYQTITIQFRHSAGLPIFVGAAPEGTQLPYATMNIVQSNPVVLSPRISAWTESLLQISVHGSQLAEVEYNLDLVSKGFRFYNSADIAGMILMNSASDYNRQPTLSGNRGWVGTLEYKVLH
jgi:hypothetical protein